MLNRSFHLSLIALATLGLAACGGGGGGSSESSTTAANTAAQTDSTSSSSSSSTDSSSSSSSSTSSTDTTSTTTTTTTTGSSGTSGSASYDKTGLYITSVYDPNSTTNAAEIRTTVIKNTAINQIELEGQTVQLVQPGIYAGGWTVLNTASYFKEVCCGRYVYSTIGHHDIEEANNYIFYNGSPTTTANMPTSGTITYNGAALLAPSDENFEEDYYRGTSALSANFGEKTLTGNLVFSDIDVNVSVNGKIEGNDISGTAVRSDINDDATLDGKFYGTNANEVAGVAYSGNRDTGWAVAFIGAKSE